jgi:hypothetical protein
MSTDGLILDLEYIIASSRWDDLEEFLTKLEESLQKALVEFEAKYYKEVKKFTPAQRQEFDDLYAEDYWRYGVGFPRILRNSFLVSACSLLEYEIGMICKRLQQKKKIPISCSDLRGDVLERAKLYCKLVGLDFPADDSTWQEVNHYIKVRNCVVHKNGLLKEFQGDKDLISYITRKGIISQDTIEQEIALTEQFCRDVVKTMRKFLEELHKVRAQE